MEADLFYNICNIRPSESQILEGAGKAQDLSGIMYRRSSVCSELHLEVDWSRARLAVSHAPALKNIQRVGALVKE